MVKYNVLLLGCDGNAGKNYAKSLKMAYGGDVFIYGTGFNRFQLLAAGKYIDYPMLMDHSKSNVEKYNEIAEFVQKYSIDFVHAQPEEEVDFLCDYGDVGWKRTDGQHLIPCYGKSIAQREFFKDKFKVQLTLGQKVFKEEDIFSLGSRHAYAFLEDTKDIWVRSNTGAGAKNAKLVHNVDEFEQWAEIVRESGRGGDLIFSEYLPGKEYAVQLFYIDGIPYHIQQRERVEQFFAKHMISGTSSTPSVARISNDPIVYRTAIDAVNKCCAAIDVPGIVPDGIYGVDIKENKSHRPVVTEINYGRYYTTSDFFSTYGVNTPADELRFFVDDIDPNFKIASIKSNAFWIRGLDMEPYTYVED